MKRKWVVIVRHPNTFEIVFVRKFERYAEANAWGMLMKESGYIVDLRMLQEKLNLEEVSYDW